MTDKPESTPILLRDREVAELLAISRRSVWRLTSSGDLPRPIKLGKAVRWRRSDIEEVIDAMGPHDE